MRDALRARLRALLPLLLPLLPKLSGRRDTWLEHVRDRVLDGARLRPDDVMLDVGAGSGGLTAAALGRLGEDGEVIALDASAERLEELRARCDDPRVWYLIGSVEALPLPDRFVDVVLMPGMLEAVDDGAGAARELFRVLRPGGRVSIVEPGDDRCAGLLAAAGFDRIAVSVEQPPAGAPCANAFVTAVKP